MEIELFWSRIYKLIWGLGKKVDGIRKILSKIIIIDYGSIDCVIDCDYMRISVI